MSTNNVNRLTEQETEYMNEQFKNDGISVDGGSVEGDTLYIDLKNRLGNYALCTKKVKEVLQKSFPNCKKIILNGALIIA